MGYAVELFFDTEAEQKIIEIWHALRAAGVSSTLMDIGSRPHISLAVWNELELCRLEPKLASFARDTDTFKIRFNGIGCFRESGAVYLEPEPTESLNAIHADFHRRTQSFGNGFWDYYLPGKWVPHCALAVDLSPEMVSQAIAISQGVYQPIEARVEHVGVVEFRPVKHLLTYRLAE